ncbi:hypothetical protein SASPL_112473 [Salvia splendens]|uniref:F-box domain-containing protein n=1 Tax=Salvia splendens TaxID=180675 RepID=A0A8X9A3B0_SALSN|nr:hypothetical protein SASPL_112473 [Salvia splendens]
MPDPGGDDSTNKGKRKVNLDDLEHQDPLLVFGSEILTIILAKLDLRSLAEARLVSLGWKPVASSDRIWGSKVIFFLLFYELACWLNCLFVLLRLRISVSYRPSPKSLNASMSCGNLPSLKSGIASYGKLTANAEWREDGNKET